MKELEVIMSEKRKTKHRRRQKTGKGTRTQD